MAVSEEERNEQADGGEREEHGGDVIAGRGSYLPAGRGFAFPPPVFMPLVVEVKAW